MMGITSYLTYILIPLTVVGSGCKNIQYTMIIYIFKSFSIITLKELEVRFEETYHTRQFGHSYNMFFGSDASVLLPLSVSLRVYLYVLSTGSRN